MRLFGHTGCESIQCIRRAIADKCRVIICLSSPGNAEKERKELNELVLKYDKLMDEQSAHSTAYSNGAPCGGA